MIEPRQTPPLNPLSGALVRRATNHAQLTRRINGYMAATKGRSEEHFTGKITAPFICHLLGKIMLSTNNSNRLSRPRNLAIPPLLAVDRYLQMVSTYSTVILCQPGHSTPGSSQ
jgi:hypothetical protein